MEVADLAQFGGQSNRERVGELDSGTTAPLNPFDGIVNSFQVEPDC